MNEEKKRDKMQPEMESHFDDSGPEVSESLESQAEEELAQVKQQLLRLQADFDNFRRRSAEERLRICEQSQGDLVEALLPVLDHFDLALSHIPQKDTAGMQEAFFDGFNMIRRQLEDVLASYGVKEIKALGEIMDPMYHEAMLRVIKQDCREGEVLQVLKKGYQMGDRVLRAAQVQVGYPEE